MRILGGSFAVRDWLGILPFSAFFRSKDKAAILPSVHSWNVVNHNLKFEYLTQKNRLKGGFSKKGGPSDRIRTCGILLPNLSGTLFLLVYSGF